MRRSLRLIVIAGIVIGGGREGDAAASRTDLSFRFAVRIVSVICLFVDLRKKSANLTCRTVVISLCHHTCCWPSTLVVWAILRCFSAYAGSLFVFWVADG